MYLGTSNAEYTEHISMMYNNKCRGGGDSFVIPVSRVDEGRGRRSSISGVNKVNLSPMRLFDRFRKIVLRFVFLVPRRGGRHPSVTRNRGGAADYPEPPKTSCSSYHYSPNSHYAEAIADCIEFLHKSAQETTAEAMV
ncbi:hypothetical protein H6P81_018866 [Aristolochia fimbriata]|uniref:Uncharacterized protein n=1 Tax=Aristolochia fimbriata TaxID=158543 RepID=A0AAV7E5B0_ARIFI|nr:hypothetical protein H6P81_018866 [Aristolochia fimbriata]